MIELLWVFYGVCAGVVAALFVLQGGFTYESGVRTAVKVFVVAPLWPLFLVLVVGLSVWEAVSLR